MYHSQNVILIEAVEICHTDNLVSDSNNSYYGEVGRIEKLRRNTPLATMFSTLHIANPFICISNQQIQLRKDEEIAD